MLGKEGGRSKEIEGNWKGWREGRNKGENRRRKGGR